MTKSRAYSVFLLAIATMCVWLVLSLPGCGPSSTTDTGLFRSLDDTDSGVPAGATCTIALCNISSGGQEGLTKAQEILAQIKQETSWSDLHIVRCEEVTKVCRGYFKSFDTDKAQRTLRQVRGYVGPNGGRPFQRALFSDLPGREEQKIVSGPAQWDLCQAPGNSSLCIAAFTDPDKRASEAVKQVKKLRDQGIEAWYYHGRYRSGVYVGHFNSAYERVTTGTTAGGDPITRKKFITHDPEFAVLRKKFPSYEMDGQVLIYRAGKVVVYECSRLVPIPRPGQEVMDSEVGL